MYSRGVMSSRLPSVSPVRSVHGYDFKENESVNTRHDDRLKDSVSTKLNHNSSDNLQASRLESRVLQLQKRIDQQKYQMETLSAQTEHYTRLCQQQKRELGSMNVEMLRQEYEEQVGQLVGEKDKLEHFICGMGEEYRQVQEREEAELEGVKQGNLELTAMIEEALSVKETILEKVAESDERHRADQLQIVAQEERLDELRNIQRKWKIALLELESLERGQ